MRSALIALLSTSAYALRPGANAPQTANRRHFIDAAAATALLLPQTARAEAFTDVTPRARTTAEALELPAGTVPGKAAALKTYVDPLFDLTFPKDWFAIRRTIDGDIVRRGNVIFSAGNLRTAEVVTVELFKAKELLTQAGALPYFPDGKVKKWNDLGKDAALGQYLCERRDNEATTSARGQQVKARASTIVPGSLSVEGDTLQADILTEIGGTTARVGEAGTEVMTPGIRRYQRARLTLVAGGEEVIGVVAGCLDDYWDGGESELLKAVVASFRIKDADTPHAPSLA
mmetsp:Transcript_28818/g.86074  ORF Transcript_28818/g.86074 Transcript_28818/m.86074 type:complete len:288 (+) Transcript_28818:113-976(+)